MNSGDKKEIDWAGVKFEIMKELGECIDILFIKIDKHSLERHYYLKPHNLADGISALIQFLEYDNKITITNIPKIKKNKRPNIFKRVRLAISHIKRQASVEYTWKKAAKDITGISPGISFFVFNRAQTIEIEKSCKAKGINSNSLLIWAIDQEARKLLRDPNQRRSWMVPINLRDSDDIKYKTGNHVTTLTIILDGEVTPVDVHTQVKEQIKSEIMWGGQIVANSPRLVGVKRLKEMAKTIRSPYIGLCSNIGSWPNKDLEISKSEKYQLIVSPPSTKYCPIALSIMCWDSQLALSIQLHPSICESLDMTNNLLSNVRKSILNFCEISDTNELPIKINWSEIENQGVYY